MWENGGKSSVRGMKWRYLSKKKGGTFKSLRKPANSAGESRPERGLTLESEKGHGGWGGVGGGGWGGVGGWEAIVAGSS